MIRGFCFDLDETLVDAEPQHRRATRAMLTALGYPTTVAQDVVRALEAPADASAPRFAADTTGRRTSDIVEDFRRAVGAPQSTEELLALRHSAFLAALDEEPAQPMPGARELVEACHARGPTALVSSGQRDDALDTLRSAGLLLHFDAIVTGDDVAEPKPAPEPYRIAATRLGLPAEELLAFEDSPRGVASARAAGCRVVAVPNARSTAPSAVSGADLVLGSLVEAMPLDALLARVGSPALHDEATKRRA